MSTLLKTYVYNPETKQPLPQSLIHPKNREMFDEKGQVNIGNVLPMVMMTANAPSGVMKAQAAKELPRAGKDISKLMGGEGGDFVDPSGRVVKIVDSSHVETAGKRLGIRVTPDNQEQVMKQYLGQGFVRRVPSKTSYYVQTDAPLAGLTDKQLEAIGKAAGERKIYIDTSEGLREFKNAIDLTTFMHGNPVQGMTKTPQQVDDEINTIKGLMNKLKGDKSTTLMGDEQIAAMRKAGYPQTKGAQPPVSEVASGKNITDVVVNRFGTTKQIKRMGFIDQQGRAVEAPTNNHEALAEIAYKGEPISGWEKVNRYIDDTKSARITVGQGSSKDTLFVELGGKPSSAQLEHIKQLAQGRKIIADVKVSGKLKSGNFSSFDEWAGFVKNNYGNAQGGFIDIKALLGLGAGAVTVPPVIQSLTRPQPDSSFKDAENRRLYDEFIKGKASPPKTPPLRIEGSVVKRSDTGEPVRFKGVTSDAFRWPINATQDGGITSKRTGGNVPDYVDGLKDRLETAKSWGTNMVGLNLEPEMVAKHEKQLDEVIKWSADNGMYVYLMPVMNSHKGAAKDKKYDALMSKLAAKYKNLPNVLYGVGTEPTGIEWNEWNKRASEIATGIRQQAPNSILIMSEPQGTRGYPEHDKNPFPFQNVIYDMHPYFAKDKDDLRIGNRPRDLKINPNLKKNHPIMIGEFGGTYARDFGSDEDIALVKEMLDDVIEPNNMSYTAYAIDPKVNSNYQPDRNTFEQLGLIDKTGKPTRKGQLIIDNLKKKPPTFLK